MKLFSLKLHPFLPLFLPFPLSKNTLESGRPENASSLNASRITRGSDNTMALESELSYKIK